MKKLLLGIIGLVVSYHVNAQEQIVTDRPGQSECVPTTGIGQIQIESGFQLQTSEITPNLTQQRLVYPSTLIKIGLGNKLELRLINELVSYKNINTRDWEKLGSISGAENLIVGLKYELKRGERLNLGLTTHLITPTGSRGISNELYGVLSRLNYNYAFNNKRSLAGGFGYEHYQIDAVDSEGLKFYGDGQAIYTLIYSQSLSDRIGVFIEQYASFPEFEDWIGSMDAGILFLVNDRFQLDYSFGWGLNHTMNFHAIGISIKPQLNLQK